MLKAIVDRFFDSKNGCLRARDSFPGVWSAQKTVVTVPCRVLLSNADRRTVARQTDSRVAVSKFLSCALSFCNKGKQYCSSCSKAIENEFTNEKCQQFI